MPRPGNILANDLPPSNAAALLRGARLPQWRDAAKAAMLALTLLATQPTAATHAMQDGNPAGADTYTVQVGDTLNSIARHTGIGVEELVRLNGLVDPDTIVVGMVLRLPERSAQPQAASEATGQLTPPNPVPAAMGPQAPGPAMPAATTPRRSTAVYIVQAGDTLHSIALRFATTPATLVDANGPAVAHRIQVGQPLVIPGAPTVPMAMSVGAGPAPAMIGSAPSMSSQSSSTMTSGPLSAASTARAEAAALRTAGAPLAPGMSMRPNDPIASMASGTAASLTPRDAQMALPASLPSASLPSASPAALAAVRIALEYNGAPYTYGGDGPAGFDCSGFVQFVMRQAGRTVPRDLLGQYTAGPHPPGPGSLEPGDLVFFQDTYDFGLSHVGIYLGEGKFIHAISEASGVGVSSLYEPYYVERWYGATRLQ